MYKFVKISIFVLTTSILYMELKFSEERYEKMLEKLFVRFPSFQKVGAGAYKPGIANLEFADQLMGHPHRKYKIIHVAGTTGKGSVSNMLASVLAGVGYKVGLYTSPHIIDFRERIRVVECPGDNFKGTFSLIPKEDVWDFVSQWQETFDHLDMSFFEITTLMALDWFAKQEVDFVVLETGLGGRLDSTNIVTPVLSVITNIGLDHCDMLGETLPEIAFEKAGIIKPRVPVVVGESHPETDSVFERKVLYTNLSEVEFMGNREAIMSLLSFADKVQPTLWDKHEELLREMDLQGDYQAKNLRTVLAAIDVLEDTKHAFAGKLWQVPTSETGSATLLLNERARCVHDAISNTALRTGFKGRWEKICDEPCTICDIGHNEHGLKYNFAQLQNMLAEGKCTDLIIVYGSVADKDVDSVIHLMPENATYIFTQAQSKRALPAEKILEKYQKAHTAYVEKSAGKCFCVASVNEAKRMAYEAASSIKSADPSASPLIYVGGSTYVVSEFIIA